MKEYHKINSVYKRDEKGNFLIGEWSEPEFEYLKDNPWLWTEKIDGMNIRVMYNGSPEGLSGRTKTGLLPIEFGGKTDNAQIPTKLLTHLQETFSSLAPFITTFGSDGSHNPKFAPVTLYGEGYGAGIQKGGGNYSPDQKFILFDVKIGDWWLRRPDVEEIAAKLHIPVVEKVLEGLTLSETINYIANEPPLISYVNSTGALHAMEGVVGTPLVPLFNRKGERIITKVKYRDFVK